MKEKYAKWGLNLQVVGVPDERYGEAVCAWVRPKHEFIDRITEEYIVGKCKEKVNSFF